MASHWPQGDTSSGSDLPYWGCALIGVQRRQVFRLLRNLKQDGATSLVSKRRGKPGNHRLPAEVRTLVLSLVRERYADFGTTFAAEKLAAYHGCSLLVAGFRLGRIYR
jgi:hypothetical protein